MLKTLDSNREDLTERFDFDLIGIYSLIQEKGP